ncbi:MAG: hypothetical protein R6W66_07195, partial [Pelovirga sp.]
GDPWVAPTIPSKNIEYAKFAGLRPRAPPYSFVTQQKSKQKNAPCRGHDPYGIHGGFFNGGLSRQGGDSFHERQKAPSSLRSQGLA